MSCSLAEVRENFRRYDLLSEDVQFLPGWFRESLPEAPVKQIALLRLDGDLYSSTRETLDALYARVVPGGFVVVGVNVDQRRSDAERFLAQVPARFTIAHDPQGTAPKLYAIKAMPSSLLIDRDGRVLLVHAGFRDEERDELEAKIAAALAARRN